MATYFCWMPSIEQVTGGKNVGGNSREEAAIRYIKQLLATERLPLASEVLVYTQPTHGYNLTIVSHRMQLSLTYFEIDNEVVGKGEPNEPALCTRDDKTVPRRKRTARPRNPGR
jgi:hypothetical protein